MVQLLAGDTRGNFPKTCNHHHYSGKKNIYIYIDAFTFGAVSLIIIKPRYVLLLTAGSSYQELLTPLGCCLHCTGFTISDSTIKQKLISRHFFSLQEASHVNSYFLASIHHFYMKERIGVGSLI